MMPPLHCRPCSAPPASSIAGSAAEVAYRVPADDNRERAICPACGEIPLREPDQRRRHGAGVGRAGAAVSSQHRASLRPVDPAGGLPRTRRERRRRRAARNGGRGRREHRTQGCSRCWTWSAPARCTSSTAPACWHPAGPGRESIEARLFREDEVPWDELAFRTVRQTLEHFFDDRRRGSVRLALRRHRLSRNRRARQPLPARRRHVGARPCATSAAMPIASPSVGCGWMVLPMSTASAPISMASAISPIMSPACVPTMPPPTIAVRLRRRTAAW